MGMFDKVELGETIGLPDFPDDKNPRDLEWQTKTIGTPSMQRFRITDDGRLMRKEVERAEMTEGEADEYAQENGYESWDAWVEADTTMGKPLESWKLKVVDEWWEDHNMDGTFEFHASGKRVDGFEDFFWSYQASFADGELDEITFLGERGN